MATTKKTPSQPRAKKQTDADGTGLVDHMAQGNPHVQVEATPEPDAVEQPAVEPESEPATES